MGGALDKKLFYRYNIYKMIKIDVSGSEPLYVQVRESIKSEILNKELLPGERLPTEEELSKQLSVSVGTIKDALLDLVREGFIIRRPRLGTFVKEPKNTTEKTGSNIIGVLVPQIDHSIFSSIVRGIEDVANTAEYRIIIGSTDYIIEKERVYISSLLERNNIAGLIVSMPKYGGEVKNYLRLIEQGISVVLLEEHPKEEIDYICIDSVYSGHIATKHLISLGYRKIGYLGTLLLEKGYSPDKDRFEGYNKALSEAGITFNEKLVITTNDNFEKGDEKEKERMIAFLSQNDRPEAIFAVNDMRAKRLYEIAKEMGLSVPKDLAIIGHDNLEITQYFEVPLTTVSPPRYEIGRRAMEILLSKIAGDKRLYQELVKGELIVRDSCGAKSKLGTAPK